jgi:hypothetical protein
MSPRHQRITDRAAERYDQALRYGQDTRLPPGAPRPLPTSRWPPENVAPLERYRAWLLGGGSSPRIVASLYLPMAGHALGLNLKPHPTLDLDRDLGRALDHVQAKGVSAEWQRMCRNALDRFRRFLRQERGLAEVRLRPPSHERYVQGLPGWLAQELERYQHLLQTRWRPARLDRQTTWFWHRHARFWR